MRNSSGISNGMKKLILAAVGLLLIFPTLTFASGYNSWTRQRLGPSTGYGEPKMSANGKYMVVQKMAGPIHTGTFWFFKVKGAKPLWRYKGSKIFDLAISKKGDYVAAVGSKIQLFSKKSKRPLWSNNLGVSVMDSVAITPDGNYIVTGDRFGTVFLFEKGNRNSIKTWRVFPGEFVNKAVISSDGKYLVVGSDLGVALLDRNKNNPVWKYKTKEADGSADSILHLSMSSSGKYFVATTSQGDNLYLFNKNKRKPKWTYHQDSFHPI
ncbi:MAG: WD40 repeat domain-containing protein [Patescibacteria group bacterium]